MVASENAEAAERLRRLELDELLDELQVRIAAACSTRDRVHQLLEAVLTVGRELDVDQVLERVVETAVELLDCEYGALGVVGEGQVLARFVPVGATEEQIAAIGHYPSGKGILGELIRNPKPLRLREIHEHPASCGFPPGHPPMHSFLGVPVRVGEEVFGNLYLTEKRGSREFEAEDESVLRTLAVAAGIAIENARLYREARDRQEWVAASAEVTRRLLSGVDEDGVVGLIVDHARRILAADLALLALPVQGSDALRMALAVGTGAEHHQGLVLPRRGSFAGAAFASAEPVTSVDITHDPRVTVGPPRWQGLGPAIAVPMIAEGRVRGAVLLARAAGEPAFAESESAPLLGFAAQAALAMELAERRRDAEQFAILEDHDRIARDLHDLAIQRLFAAGMTLQSTVRLVENPQASERLLRVVDDLDETIKIIRSTIFGLRNRQSAHGSKGLRARVAKTVQDAVPVLGFTPTLRMEGLVDTDVPPAVGDEVVAVLGEGLSNIARHAHAHAADVRVVVGSGQVALTVTDDGIGIAKGGRRSGLANLAQRAAGLGGEFAVDAGPDGGTRLSWKVPLSV